MNPWTATAEPHKKWRLVVHSLYLTTYYLCNISFIPDVSQCYDDDSSCSLRTHLLLAHNLTEIIPRLNSLCVGDVPPAGLAGFGRGGAVVFPRHEHVWGQLNVQVVFGQGEEGAAARMALWQGQPHVCILGLRRTTHIISSNQTLFK